MIVFGEGGVAVDVGAEAFAEDELGVGDVEVGVELGAGGALDAVVGPEVLGAVGGFDGVGEGLLAGVGAGEGDVVGGCQSWVRRTWVEAGGEGVDAGDDGVAAGDGEGSAGEEVELHVDDEEGVGGAGRWVITVIVRRGDGWGGSGPLGWAGESISADAVRGLGARSGRRWWR